MERMFQSFEGKFRTLLLEKTFHSLQALLKKKKAGIEKKKKKKKKAKIKKKKKKKEFC